MRTADENRWMRISRTAAAPLSKRQLRCAVGYKEFDKIVRVPRFSPERTRSIDLKLVCVCHKLHHKPLMMHEGGHLSPSIRRPHDYRKAPKLICSSPVTRHLSLFLTPRHRFPNLRGEGERAGSERINQFVGRIVQSAARAVERINSSDGDPGPVIFDLS